MPGTTCTAVWNVASRALCLRALAGGLRRMVTNPEWILVVLTVIGLCLAYRAIETAEDALDKAVRNTQTNFYDLSSNKMVRAYEQVHGYSHLYDKKHYLVVTYRNIRSGNDESHVQVDGPYAVARDGNWVLSALFGDMPDYACRDNVFQYAVHFFATSADIQPGKISNYPSDAIISARIPVTRRCDDRVEPVRWPGLQEGPDKQRDLTMKLALRPGQECAVSGTASKAAVHDATVTSKFDDPVYLVDHDITANKFTVVAALPLVGDEYASGAVQLQPGKEVRAFLLPSPPLVPQFVLADWPAARYWSKVVKLDACKARAAS